MEKDGQIEILGDEIRANVPAMELCQVSIRLVRKEDLSEPRYDKRKN
jgi:hypothetical protein